MSLDKSKIEHLPDLTDRLGDPYQRFHAVEIAEWKSTITNQYVLRYVAGRATVISRVCLVTSTNKHEDGSIMGRERPPYYSCADYRVIIKL